MSAEDRRQAIIDAVLPLLVEHGEAVSTRQIAEAAGIAEGTIFRVFPDKNALLMAAAAHTLNPPDAGQELADAVAGIEDLHELVRVVAERMLVRSEQVMAVMILPAAAVIAFFSREIMLLWTGSPEIAGNTAPIVSILVAGTALNGLMNLPYALQLSHGWTRIGLGINTVFIVTLVPAIVLTTTRFGAVGAASVWLGLNAIYMIIGIPLTHRRLLKGEALRWFTRDVGIPLAGSLIFAGSARMIFDDFSSLSRSGSAALLLLVLLLAVIGAALCTPATRDFISHSIFNRKQAAEPPY